MQEEMRLTEEQKSKLLSSRATLLRRMREIVAARSKIFTQLGKEMTAYSMVRTSQAPTVSSEALCQSR